PCCVRLFTIRCGGGQRAALVKLKCRCSGKMYPMETEQSLRKAKKSMQNNDPKPSRLWWDRGTFVGRIGCPKTHVRSNRSQTINLGTCRAYPIFTTLVAAPRGRNSACRRAERRWQIDTVTHYCWIT